MQLLFPSLVSVIYKICQTKNYYLRQLCRIGHFCFCFIAICVLFANQRPAIYFSLTIYSILVSWRKLEQFSPGVRRVHPGEVSVCVAHTGYQIVLLLSAIKQSSDFYKYCFSLTAIISLQFLLCMTFYLVYRSCFVAP